MEQLLKYEIANLVKTAKELGYTRETVKKLRKAKTGNEATLIMTTARERGEIGSVCYR